MDAVRRPPGDGGERETAAPEGAGLLLAGGMLSSRILGLLRDMALAWLLGTGPAADALAAAMRLPHVLRRLLAEGSLSMSLSAALARLADPAEAHALARAVSLRLGLALAILTPCALLLAPALTAILAPGLDASRAEEAVLLLRLCLPYAAAAGMASCCMALLQARGAFFWPAFSPAIFNLVVLSFIGMAALGLGDAAILPAAGMTCAGCVQWAIQAAAARRLRPADAAAASPAAASDAWRRLAEAPVGVLGAAAPQLAALVAAACASFGAPGGLAALHYAERLLELPLGLTGVCIAMAGLPRWSVLAAGGRKEDFARSLSAALRPALALGLAAAAGLAAVGRETVDLLLGHGAFGAEAVDAAAWALLGFLPGLPACAAARPLLAACNAAGAGRDTARAAVPAVLAALAGGIASAMFPVMGTGPFAPALAVSAGMWIQLLSLRRTAVRACGGASLFSPQAVLRAVLAALAAGGAARMILEGAAVLQPHAGDAIRAAFLLLAIGGGGTAWAVFLWISGDGDIRRMADVLRRGRFGRGA